MEEEKPRRIPHFTERHAMAIELRKRGFGFIEIGQQMRISPHAAEQLVKKGLRRLMRGPATELRTLEYERLSSIIKVFWPKVLKGNVRAAALVLRTISQIADLMGLNAPIKMEGSGLTLAQLIMNVHQNGGGVQPQMIEGEAVDVTQETNGDETVSDAGGEADTDVDRAAG